MERKEMGEVGVMIDLEAELKKIRHSAKSEKKHKSKRCIYRVPKVLRALNDKAYSPSVVSFGPYHHGLPHLKPMEVHKYRALVNYLDRAGKSLEEMVEAVRPNARELIEAYDELEEGWWRDEDAFLKLMILDGCFFLDTLLWKSVDYGWSYMHTRLLTDTRMLENQLPLPLLATLLELGGDENEHISKLRLYDLRLSKIAEELSSEDNEEFGLHHLDLGRKHRLRRGEYSYDSRYIIPSATELMRAGVHIERSKTNSFTDIEFHGGVLTLPWVVIDDITEPVFLNMLAFEQIHPDVVQGVTSYLFLMDNLINTARDVAVLKEKGILEGWVRNHDIAADLFNCLTTEISSPKWSDSSSMINVNRNIKEYCSRRWPKWRASFIRHYLSSPWVFISLVGALVLLVLTIARTVYAVLAYYKQA